MASLKDLGLSNAAVGGDVDFDNLPKVGAFAPVFQPGKYRFRLPQNLGNVWEKVEALKGERIAAAFDQDAPLLVVQSPGNERNGEPFQTRVSNVERPRGREKVEVSDLDYLLKALGETTRPKTNAQYIQALMKHGGKEFGATVELQWSCSDRRDIYVDDGQGGSQQVEGQKGCGARYYQKDVQKGPDGKYPERITCGNESCGASLRAFSQLGAIG